MITVETSFSSICNSESKFIGEGHDQFLSNFETFFWSSRGTKVTSRGAFYWMKCIEAINAFMINKDKDSLVLSNPMAICAKHPLMRKKTKARVSTMPIESAQQSLNTDEDVDEEKVLVAQLR